MLSITKSRYNGKRLLVLFVLLFTVFITYTVDAQEYGLLRKPSNVILLEKIQGPLGDPTPAGTYSIGTGGYFPTIDSAFNKLSIDGVAGNVTLELIDELYVAPATQFGFLLNGPIPGAGATSRVTIKPAQNKNVTIEGSNESLLYLINTSYVTFDGVSTTGPTTLTIHALQNSAYVFNDALDFINNSDHNIIQNITFIVEDNLRASGSGFWYSYVGAFAPDSNLIQNNFVKKAGLAFFVISSTSTTRCKGNIIRENHIGSETDSLVAYGIQVNYGTNTIIESNSIQNLKSTITGSNQLQVGILSYGGNGDIIRNNIIHNFRAISGFTSSGIYLTGSWSVPGSYNYVYNNMVYNINSVSNLANNRVAGIQLEYQNNPRVYYNSVYLSGNGANYQGSAALYIFTGCTYVEAKNNIFINTRDEGPHCASAIYDYTAGNLTSDYNDLYYDDTNNNNCLVRIAGTKYNTLADWQEMGKDFHSMSIIPCFCSPALHIDCTIATCLESRGTPISGFNTDIDGDIRHNFLPDIGADEFAGLVPTGAVSVGAYSVGTNGFFPSIETIFNRLETDGVGGNVTLELIDDLYTAPSDLFGFKIDGPIPGAGPNSRVTIKPAGNKNVTVVGGGRMTLSFWNTSYVTIDGVDLTGATTLTIHTLQNPQYPWNEGIDFLNNSDHNIIQNTIFINEDYTRAGGGIGIFSLTDTQSAPDSNIVRNNLIKRSGIGIYLSAYNTGAFTIATGNIIRGNVIGSETDTLISWGMQIEKTYQTIIENNFIGGIRRHSNTFELTAGINSYWGLNNVIRNNIVRNVHSYEAAGSTGILLSGVSANAGSLNMVYNNMVYDIQSLSSQNDSRVCGILMWQQNSPKIYYNSVYLTGTGANHFGSAALRIEGTTTNADVKNNIMINVRDDSPYCASAIFNYQTTNYTSDYNVLFYDDTNQNNCLARVGSIDYKTLTDYQVTLRDLHSYVEMPHFVEPYLEIDPTIPTYLESRGTPIAGIETDYKGDTRNAMTPDIGADEFDGIVGVEDEKTLLTEYALEQNYPNPFNPSTTFRYSIPQTSKVVIKVYDILGNEIALLMDEEKTVGTYELNWNAASLPSGVYFYQLKSGSFLETKKMLLLK
ncbi:MAG TPA: T9SS type A sorting domain-containing protein [Ignavibacteriaceae bacterium]|nr:T9SS type A sorting domain-containing protein [Ignavibacteriaceae bacterium]